MSSFPFSVQELYTFIKKAGQATYAGGGKFLKDPERPGFSELEYSEGDFSYRDSFAGFYRSRGMEVVRYQDNPIWASSYGGGMTQGHDQLASETFSFLKSALFQKSDREQSLRGPASFSNGDWVYEYNQDGTLIEFSGFEKILFKNDVVFEHRIIGGMIEGRYASTAN